MNHGDFQQPMMMLCGTQFGSDLVTGATNGCLYVWEGQTVSSTRVAHDRGITCLLTLNAHTSLISGSMDGTIIIWKLQKYSENLQNGLNTYFRADDRTADRLGNTFEVFRITIQLL